MSVLPYSFVNILGAPGAGKSRLSMLIEQKLDNFVRIDVDAYYEKYDI